MVRWQDIEAEVPDLAAAVRAVFDAHRHKTIATLRRDGAPRISGNEARFMDGELLLGMMPGSVKARDLLRDPRVAIHSATVDEELKQGDAKISGRAFEVDDGSMKGRFIAAFGDPGGPFHLFRVDVNEVVLTRVGTPADHLVIESWHPGRGVERLRRS